GVSPASHRPPGSAHWPRWERRPAARRVSSSAVPRLDSLAATRVMATAARFNSVAGSRAGKGTKAAQHSAMVRLVASSKGRVIPLDYNSPANDEMTGDRKRLPDPDR